MIKTLAVDDLDAAEGRNIEAFDTVYIYRDGKWFELHLTQEHIAQYHDDLAPYLQVARKSQGPAKKAPPTGKRKPYQNWADFKTWCRIHGRSYTSANGHWSPKAADIRDWEASKARAPQDRSQPAA